MPPLVLVWTPISRTIGFGCTTRPLATLALAAISAAQGVVVPSAAATTMPAIWESRLLAPGNSHTQSLYDSNDVSVIVGLWSSLSLRRPAWYRADRPAFSTNMTIVMSVGPNAPEACSRTFAANHGITTTVFLGTISLPASPAVTTWPVPWEPAIQFQSPFLFVRGLGPSLVVDILQAGNTSTSPCYLEASDVPLGGGNINGANPTCRLSNRSPASYLETSGAAVGCPWWVTYWALPFAVGVGALGSVGQGGIWNGVRLPIDLTSLGAPGCTWSVSVELTVPLAADATGAAAWPLLHVPNDPALAGKVFYDQGAFLDPLANALGAVVTYSLYHVIGAAPPAPRETVWAIANATTATSGQLSGMTAVTMQFR